MSEKYKALTGAVVAVVAWGRGEKPWPDSASGLLDIAATGLAGFGVAAPPYAGEPDGEWISDFFAAAEKLTFALASGGWASRTRAALAEARAQAKYHCDIVEREAGDLDQMPEAWRWDRNVRRSVNVSFAELLSQFATVFSVLGRVPHCGPEGRALLLGAVDHPGPDPFVPQRPSSCTIDDRTAEVQLHFGLSMLVETKDDSLAPDVIKTGWSEPWKDGLVRRCLGRGDVAVDVGARLGYSTLLMAHQVTDTGKVFAFEPKPRLHQLLGRSLAWGHLRATTTLLPFAAWSGRHTAKIPATPGSLGGQHLPGRLPGSAYDALRARYPTFEGDDIRALDLGARPGGDTYDVRGVCLDDTVGKIVPVIHFMLIDVGGAEPWVLDGARHLIRRSRDLAMLIGCAGGQVSDDDRRARLADTINWLSADGFRFWTVEADSRDVYARAAILTPLAATDLLGRQERCVLFVCRPRSG